MVAMGEKMIKSIIQKVVLLMINIANMLLPKDNNCVMLYSMPDYADNARAIFEYMSSKEEYRKFHYVWVVKDLNGKRNTSYVKFVKHKSFQSLYYFLRAKYIFRTHSLFGNLFNPKKQRAVYTGHGMPIKDVTIKGIKHNSLYTDTISTSPMYKKIISECLNSDESLCHITGLPRNDYLFSGESILDCFDLSKYDKIIIWMPTFRKSRYKHCEGKVTELGIPLLKSHELNLINDKLRENDICLLIKPHPWAEDKLNLEYSNIKKITDKDFPETYTLYNLLGQCDALLTDYSGVYVDFMILDRPIGFVIEDIEEYKRDRGFLFEPISEYQPGNKINCIDEFVDFIDDVATGKDMYKEERNRINKIFNLFCDNQSSKRVVEGVIK